MWGGMESSDEELQSVRYVFAIVCKVWSKYFCGDAGLCIRYDFWNCVKEREEFAICSRIYDPFWKEMEDR